jgi:hypothetical protein
MTQTHSNLQATRSVTRNSRPSTPDPDEIIYIAVYTDPETKNQFVLWDDIRQVFEDALHVRHQAKALPFLKGTDYNPYVLHKTLVSKFEVAMWIKLN